MDPRPLSIVVAGAGPRGVGFLERLAANLPELLPGADIVVHLVDPHPPGAGRIWRRAQSPLLRLNSMARDVTMYTDESSVIDGPVRPGPSLIDWAEEVRQGLIGDVVLDDPGLRDEITALRGESFPTRRLQSEYLAWFYRRALAELPARVVEHAGIVARVDEAHDGTQSVQLASGQVIEADVVLYALGHTGADPDADQVELAAFADRHGLGYVPPSFTADANTDFIEPAEPVIVRGMGLAAVDLVVLLAEGRGGSFVPAADGTLEYLPSGREPRILLGSRRGIPYHSKISSTLVAPRPAPRFFDAAIAGRLEASRDRLSFRHDVWPLIASELLWGYYHELFVGHPDRVTVPWETFSPFLEKYAWNSSKLKAVVAATVPDAADRLDLDELDRPLRGVRTASRAELQEHVRDYIRADLHARSDPGHSATLGLFTSLLYALFDLGTIVTSSKWTALSRAYELGPWWMNFFSFVASGPPASRLEELLALSRAGVVEFLGADLEVVADEAGVFRASSSSTPGSVTARVLVDARLPPTSVRTTDNVALRSLIETGVAVEERVADAEYSGTTGRLLVDGDARIVTADGSAHPRRFAIGPFTNAPFIGAFSRPGTNAVSFRENDRVARAVLHALARVPALDARR